MKNNKPELITDECGIKFWYLNGKLHREDGPAILSPNGSERWYIKGKLHREGGPAIINSYGSKFWYVNGEHHRENGPAIIYSGGFKEWWLNDKRYTYDEWFNLLTLEQQINYLWNLNEL